MILGASRIEQLRDNLGALQHVRKMTPELMEKIEDIVDNRPDPFSRF